jgi:outer membrane protein assembly factor BamB
VAYVDGTTGVYLVRQHRQIQGLADEGGQIGGAWLSADYLYLGYAVGDESDPRCEIRSIDTNTLQRTDVRIEIDRCDVPFLQAVGVSATAGGDLVAVSYPGVADFEIAVYDGRTGERVGEPLVGGYTPSFGPDDTLVVGYLSGEIIQYDPETLDPIGAFPGLRGVVEWLSFSADGTLLLAGSERNQNISIYNVPTRTRLGDPIVSDLPYVSGNAGPALRPDGKVVAVNSQDGIAVWNIDPDYLADAACNLAGRNLTQSEWDTYLGRDAAYRDTCPEYELSQPVTSTP